MAANWTSHGTPRERTRDRIKHSRCKYICWKTFLFPIKASHLFGTITTKKWTHTGTHLCVAHEEDKHLICVSKITTNERQVWGKLAVPSAHNRFCVLVAAKPNPSLFYQGCSDFVPSACPCLPNVLMTLATVTTEETHLSLIPSWPRRPI